MDGAKQTPKTTMLLALRGIALVMCFFLLMTSVYRTNTVYGQTTSITPSGLGTIVTQNGTVHEIAGGTRAGSNLFHSFGNFSIAAGDMARFQPTPLVPDITINNILGRVTGGNPSNIFGAIDSVTYYPAANLFLMNPAGIVLGPSATLNVGGIVNFTTADYLRLSDSTRFEAIPSTQDALLSTASVEAFGFLGANPAALTVHGSQLLLLPSTGVSFAAGDVAFTADMEAGVPATILSPSGAIRITSVASPGEILFPNLETAANINGQTFTTMGRVTIADGTFLDVSGDSAGMVRIRGGQLLLDSSAIMASSFGPIDGPPTAIEINAQENVTLTNGSAMLLSAEGTGRTGDLLITTQTLDIENGSALLSITGGGRGSDIVLTGERVNFTGGAGILSDTFGGGQGGNIIISASDTFAISGTDPFGNPSLIGSSASDEGSGGAITLNAGSAVLADRGFLDTGTSGVSPAGDITLQVNSLEIRGGASIQSSGGAGSSGTVRIVADSVLVTGQVDTNAKSRIENTNASGPTGDIAIAAREVIVTEDARINTTSGGAAGEISILATESITVSSRAKIRTENISDFPSAGITLSAPSILLNQGLVQTKTGSPGDAGPVQMTADLLTIQGSRITTETEQTIGRGGDVTFTADQMMLSGQFTGSDTDAPGPAGIFTRTFNSGGDAGNVQVTANTLTIAGGAQINSNTSSSGDGGILTVVANNQISISGAGSGLFSETTASGNGGTITARSPQVQITNGAVLSATSTGIGNAGTVRIQGTASPAQSILITGPGSGVLTETSNTGAGGDITAWSYELDLTGGATISARTTGQMPNAGDAGNILIKADDITISGGATITAASTGTGGAGTVTIQGANSPAQSLVITGAGSGVFSDTSGTGAGGDILAISDSVLITNGGTLSAATSGTEASAVGGTIGVEATAVRIENGGLVTAASSGAANGGNIAILAEQSVTVNSQGTVSTRATGAGNAGSIGILAGGDFRSSGGSVSTTAAQGTGGDILVAAGQDIRLTDHASLSANSSGPGNAGDITALAGDDFIMVNSSITTQAAQNSGGNIKIGAGDVIQITNSLVSASVQGGGGSGGNIDIDPLLVLLQNSQVRANAVLGNGGNITITTPLFFADQTSIVDASSQFGVHGTVSIQSPTSNLAGTVASLPSSMRQAQGLQTGRCAALANSQASSFVIAGRETIPTEPGGWLPSPVLMAEGPASPFAESLSVEGARLAMAGESLSLRRLTPAGFLTQHFAEAGTSGC